MHKVYSLHIFIVFLLHVSVPSALPSSGRTIITFTSNQI